MDNNDIKFPLTGNEVTGKQRKVRSDKGRPRKETPLSAPFSIKLDQDLLDYLNMNHGEKSRNQFINDLLRKAAGI